MIGPKVSKALLTHGSRIALITQDSASAPYIRVLSIAGSFSAALLFACTGSCGQLRSLKMSDIAVLQVDAFTRNPFQGNPAGVVLAAAGLNTWQMQAISRELNNSETAFFFPPEGDNHDVCVRFFTPICEVPVCGHATIAGMYAYAVTRAIPPCTLRMKCRGGVFDIRVDKRGEEYFIYMTQGPPIFGGVLSQRTTTELVDALGVTRSDLRNDCPVQVVSTGHSKVIVPIRTAAAMNDIRPDMVRLARLSGKIGANGFLVFTMEPPEQGTLCECRMFAPAIGIPEDPVTGNGNGPLGAYLAAHGLASSETGTLEFRALQGRVLGRPGRVRVLVRVENGRPRTVIIGDEAVIVFKTTLSLPTAHSTQLAESLEEKVSL